VRSIYCLGFVALSLGEGLVLLVIAISRSKE
jgi:hypothetical protein